MLGREATQALLNVLGVDRVLQALEFALESSHVGVMALQQPGLKLPQAFLFTRTQWTPHPSVNRS